MRCTLNAGTPAADPRISFHQDTRAVLRTFHPAIYIASPREKMVRCEGVPRVWREASAASGPSSAAGRRPWDEGRASATIPGQESA